MDPTLGNPGYDVTHYDLDIDWLPEGRILDAITTITATATAQLATVNVDFIGFDVLDVQIDGRSAAFARTPRDMTIRPREALSAGQAFTIAVHYKGTPSPIRSNSGLEVRLGWKQGTGLDVVVPGDPPQRLTIGSNTEYVVAEPDGARAWFPCNDHPSDKATYTFRITIPDGLIAAANGVLADSIGKADRTTWVWRMDRPMAAHLATVVIADYEIVEDTDATAATGVSVRNVLPTNLDAMPNPFASDGLPREGEMLTFFSGLFGPYPFESFGIAFVPGVPGALETQSLPLMGSLFEKDLAHELVHQWFGDDVSVAGWGDIWLSEGFATYGEWLWNDHRARLTLAEQVDAAYQRSGYPPPGRPWEHDLFTRSVYDRGALTLHALRLRVGDDVFFGILRAWVERYGGGSASTPDFIALAGEKSGSDLTTFLDAWLYADDKPALPTGG
jgi:aminopeptidase N